MMDIIKNIRKSFIKHLDLLRSLSTENKFSEMLYEESIKDFDNIVDIVYDLDGIFDKLFCELYNIEKEGIRFKELKEDFAEFNTHYKSKEFYEAQQTVCERLLEILDENYAKFSNE